MGSYDRCALRFPAALGASWDAFASRSALEDEDLPTYESITEDAETLAKRVRLH